MPADNPVVMCSKHAARFRKCREEVDNDGTQTLVKQYWAADCGCQVEITLACSSPKLQPRPETGRFWWSRGEYDYRLGTARRP
jgi:hypothetical protein